MKKIIFLLIMVIGLFQFCKKNEVIGFQVKALVETETVQAGIDEDAADDPAIWINPSDKSKSVIYGTNKIDNGGIYAYDLQGNKLAYYEVGAINNIDVRYGLSNGNEIIDILGGSNRTDSTLTFLSIDENGSCKPIGKLKSTLLEVYGFCLHHDQKNEVYYAFVVGKDGTLEQWKIGLTEDLKITGKIVRKTFVGSKSEGLVADDELNVVYVGEEEKAIWKYNTDPATGDERTNVAMSDKSNPNIAYDIEGLAIYYMPDGEGYLIASSQGNFSYAIFNRKTNNYITSFSVVDGTVDGSQETDGLDVLNISLTNEFDGGIFVVQDGFNYDNDTKCSQNFKYISWKDIVNLSDGKLQKDSNYDHRK
ncbi:phytase [Methanococcoides sp. SA1]|nr:phytase [Methanococcoides sp. SA1]